MPPARDSHPLVRRCELPERMADDARPFGWITNCRARRSRPRGRACHSVIPPDGKGRSNVLQSDRTTHTQLTDTYNPAGMVTDEQYPSLKTIHTDYDSAGRVAGAKNTATGTYYAGAASGTGAMSYAPHGGVTSMLLGNSLIEQTKCNSRLQPTMIQLGPASTPSDVLELTYGYAEDTSKDNGNVLSQKIMIGAQEVGTQNYSYDGLNRIGTTSESQGGLGVWSQTFDYDQFGNMAITHSDIP
jgi:hypothetical protein